MLDPLIPLGASRGEETFFGGHARLLYWREGVTADRDVGRYYALLSFPKLTRSSS